MGADDEDRLVVSDAGVDDQLQPRRFDQQRVEAELQVLSFSLTKCG